MSARTVVMTKYPEVLAAWCAAYIRFPDQEPYPLFVHDGPIPEGWQTFRAQHIEAPMPFRAARNMNLCFKSAYPRDCFVVNDDACFTQAGTLEALAALSDANPDYGIIFPAVDGEVGFGGQKKGALGNAPLIELNCGAFVAAYVRQKVIETVGGWYEGYTGYGWDDIDFALRVRMGGWKIGVASQIIVKHGFGEFASGTTYAMTARETGNDIGLSRTAGIFHNRWKHAMSVLHDYSPAYLGAMLAEIHKEIS